MRAESMKRKLFGNTIQPACRYCEKGRISTNKTAVFCKKKGVVDPDNSCRAFVYAPLKRIPHRAAALPLYRKEDFEL